MPKEMQRNRPRGELMLVIANADVLSVKRKVVQMGQNHGQIRI